MVPATGPGVTGSLGGLDKRIGAGHPAVMLRSRGICRSYRCPVCADTSPAGGSGQIVAVIGLLVVFLLGLPPRH